MNLGVEARANRSKPANLDRYNVYASFLIRPRIQCLFDECCVCSSARIVEMFHVVTKDTRGRWELRVV